MKKKYLTVFPGIRDQYQIPLALYENGRLKEFITDFFNRGLLKFLFSFAGKSTLINKRFKKELSGAPVYSQPLPVILSKIQSIFFQKSKVSVWEDLFYANIAFQKAERLKVNLFLYEFQAEYAFKKPILFL